MKTALSVTGVTALLILMMFSNSVGGSRRVTDIITYSGLDDGAGTGDPRPNSDAAASSFDAAVGSYSLITFEGLTIGDFTTLLVAPGVRVTLTYTSSDGCAGITHVSDTDLGYNTTVDGKNHLRVVPQFHGPDVLVTFAFASPIEFFGAYLTGTETILDGSITLSFNDGSTQALLIPKNNLGGGVQFFGFTAFGTSISSVAFQQAGPFTTAHDIWGIDDVRYGPPAEVTRIHHHAPPWNWKGRFGNERDCFVCACISNLQHRRFAYTAHK